MNRTPLGRSEVIATHAISEDPIAPQVPELGEMITRDHSSLQPVLVSVLHGSFMFHTDLDRAIAVRCGTDFLALTRFRPGGRMSPAMDTDTNPSGRHVLVVEDIVDTGPAHQTPSKAPEARDCRSLRTVTLPDRTSHRIVDPLIAYRGFEVGDEFLVGYGPDRRGGLRNL